VKDNIDSKLDELLKGGSHVVGPGTEELKRVLEATVILIRSIRRLDTTSSRLAVGNIVVGVLLAILAGIQICLMLRGH
jgi:hypothetical protein